MSTQHAYIHTLSSSSSSSGESYAGLCYQSTSTQAASTQSTSTFLALLLGAWRAPSLSD